LYAAVRSIGEALRTRYRPPEEVPSDMVWLLTQIKESTEPELQRARCVLEYHPDPWLDQIVMAEFIKDGGYRRHLREIRELYRITRDVLVGSLKRHFGDQYIFGKYSGMRLMWTLPPSLAPAQKFAALALSQDVGIYTLEAVGAVDFTGNLVPSSH
jgi:DNA-binding transcriptional MocR family regulator